MRRVSFCLERNAGEHFFPARTGCGFRWRSSAWAGALRTQTKVLRAAEEKVRVESAPGPCAQSQR